jgi:AP-3 complex subunit delta
MFEKTLTDVVKGIRASKRDTALYISQCIAEIKTEINSSDMFVKANALQKLTFLQMMGYSMSWASFASIEVMSSPRFAHKRIGYLAASQGFTQDTDVVLLTTNLLKKELRGAVGGGMLGVYEAGLAINCISNIVTEDLASDLLPELTTLTTHHQPYLRKKAILCLFKVFVKYPQGLRLTFSKLQHCLSDSNASVVSCAVNVITELSDKNPRNYLHLAPAFFDLLTQSSNNWMLIKVVKLLGSLVPEEPRLARKLLDPLATIVKNTQAKSLLYEAVHTITLCLPYCRKSDGTMPANVPNIVVLCAQVLRSFVEESDQNLKYLGLVGFGSLMQSHSRILSAPDYRPLILTCLSDQDVTIRTRSLDLLQGMASQKNLMELVAQLLKHVENATGTYKLDLVAKIVEMCSGDKYGLLRDFAWYLDVLFQLGHMRGVEKHADLLRSQIVDVALRVLPVRAYAVRKSMTVLLEDDTKDAIDDGSSRSDFYGDNGRGKHLIQDILPGAAWIVGEYFGLLQEALSIDDDANESFVTDNCVGAYHTIVQTLTGRSQVLAASQGVQQVYLQSAMKVASAAMSDSRCSTEEMEACMAALVTNFSVFMHSPFAEVAERSSTLFELITVASGTVSVLDLNSRGNGQQSDLLGLLTVSAGASSLSPSNNVPHQPSESSETFCYVLKPSPMKPIGAKAQRKKLLASAEAYGDHSPSTYLSLIGDVLIDEEECRFRSKSRLDCVSFSEQKLRSVVDTTVANTTSSSIDIFTTSSMNSNTPNSFQKPEGTPAVSSGVRRQGDPFYLDSTPSQANERQRDGRFGTIQLLDSDDELASADRKPKKKKKEKKARRNNSDGMNLMDFVRTNGNPGETLYESDDDEDDGKDGRRASGRATHGSRRKNQNKEFDGLAKVDLTTPLREDEVMPERRHREVPLRAAFDPDAEAKARKRTKKQRKKNTNESVSETVGDLLGFGVFDPLISTPTTTVGPPLANSNPVNGAFDDLLGLANETSNPSTFNVFDSIAPSNGEKAEMPNRRIWLTATLKYVSASGPPSCDWSQTTLLYRLHRTIDGEQPAAVLTFKLENQSSHQVSDLLIELSSEFKAKVGTVPARSTVESTDQVGPVLYDVTDRAKECRGRLVSAGSQIPFKLSLPASTFLRPVPNLSLDSIAKELASGEWSAFSAKISVPQTVTIKDVKLTLCRFLNAEEIQSAYGSPDGLATFAAMSGKSGAQVRALVKIKEGGVKVDLRCTSSTLGKALASDMKRLRF